MELERCCHNVQSAGLNNQLEPKGGSMSQKLRDGRRDRDSYRSVVRFDREAEKSQTACYLHIDLSRIIMHGLAAEEKQLA